MLATTFEQMNVDTVVIERNIDTVLELQALGKEAFFGDASRRVLLDSAGLSRASYLVLSFSDFDTTVAVLGAAKQITTSVPIFVRCHYERDRQHLLNAGAEVVVSEEVLVAQAMAESVLGRTKASKFRVRREVQRIQEKLGFHRE
jgi:CPA2 family monovalent cation:H+ antiporter-2